MEVLPPPEGQTQVGIHYRWELVFAQLQVNVPKFVLLYKLFMYLVEY